MDVIIEGFWEAINLIFSGDQEIFEVVSLSLLVSGVALLISTILGIPAGIFLGVRKFPGKSIVIRIVYTWMSLPPVIAGLALFLILMRRGPFGHLALNYTTTAMVMVQVILVTPIIMGLTYNMVKEKAETIRRLGVTLGASRFAILKLMITEMRIGLIAAVVSGFGRAISEVGAVMIVGGNIKGKTRMMTTYISELKSMGDYSRAIAIGLVLLVISFVINAILYNFQERDEKR